MPYLSPRAETGLPKVTLERAHDYATGVDSKPPNSYRTVVRFIRTVFFLRLIPNLTKYDKIFVVSAGMALPLPPGLTPPEVAFLCEMEMVTIVPRQRLEGLELLGVSRSCWS